MRLHPRQKLIAASAASALALGASVWIFWFFASGVSEDGAARAAIQARLDGFAQDRLRTQAFGMVRARRQEDIGRILGFFVDRARPIVFLQALEGLGRATGTAVAIEVDDAAGDGGHLGLRVIAEGSGQQTMARFVRLLERLPYAVTVTQINEEKKSSDAGARPGPSDRLVVALRVRTK